MPEVDDSPGNAVVCSCCGQPKKAEGMCSQCGFSGWGIAVLPTVVACIGGGLVAFWLEEAYWVVPIAVVAGLALPCAVWATAENLHALHRQKKLRSEAAIPLVGQKAAEFKGAFILFLCLLAAECALAAMFWFEGRFWIGASWLVAGMLLMLAISYLGTKDSILDKFGWLAMLLLPILAPAILLLFAYYEKFLHDPRQAAAFVTAGGIGGIVLYVMGFFVSDKTVMTKTIVRDVKTGKVVSETEWQESGSNALIDRRWELPSRLVIFLGALFVGYAGALLGMIFWLVRE